MATRRRLFTELQPLVTSFDGHPWDWAAHEAGQRTHVGTKAHDGTPGKDLSFVPLKPYGAALLIAAGLGIITYGLYSFAMARYTKM
jgi:hypothetical protein